MPPLFRAALAALSLAVVLGLPATAHAASPTKVAIIVGPVGTLTPTYLALAEAAAATAERHGATVARAYSPNATPANVLAAVADANVVIYFGHGYGHPSPYGGLNTARQNGWGLQGPRAHGTHGDGLGGELQYYGEDWIVANARPAPGFVMIYSNTCYAPGASEGGFAPATQSVAAQRVAYYSRKVFAMGGSAYFATDFDRGAADLVGRLLTNRGATFGTAFASDQRYVPWGLSAHAHPFSAGQSIWLHHSKYTDGPPNYWYAFAGNPDLTPLRAWDRTAPTARLTSPSPNALDVAPSASIAVRISESVSGVDATTLGLRDAAGELVPATVTYDAASHVATVKPDSPLELSSRYWVVVTDGIRDDAGRNLKRGTWSFSTRLDADALTAPLSVILEAGDHELLRFAADGSVAEERTLEVIDRRWVVADQRARLHGLHGSWFRVEIAGLGAWWVAESAVAHALGQTEEAALATGTQVTLPATEHQLHGFGPEGPTAVDGKKLRPGQAVTVDRRRVFDGRTFLRLAEGTYGGAWIEADPVVVPTEASSQRMLAVTPRRSTVSVVLDDGAYTAFRFDDAGRVIARRALTDADVSSTALTTSESRVVGGATFAMIDSGPLEGWALAEGAGLHLLAVAHGPDSAD